jgi:hypothetical protein
VLRKVHQLGAVLTDDRGPAWCIIGAGSEPEYVRDVAERVTDVPGRVANIPRGVSD